MYSSRTLQWAHYMMFKGEGRTHDAHEDYVYGMECGYPECCVEFYCELRDLGILYVGQWADDAYGEPNKETGYVQCLKCRA